MADRMIMVSSEQQEREELARQMAEMAENPLTETVEGGKYINAAGETVNAKGEPLKASKSAKAADEDEDESPKSASKSGARKGGK